jgi:E3 ubiquitin-protein ligase makorin
MCRNVSRFVIPSSIFYKSSDPMKVVVVERYKESMKKVRCRYFEASPPNKRFCPFGKDCFYKHQDENGQDYVFEKGVEDCMRVRHSQA